VLPSGQTGSSPDGGTLLFALLDPAGIDLMLAEDFR
jgi:hypothetical protein